LEQADQDDVSTFVRRLQKIELADAMDANLLVLIVRVGDKLRLVDAQMGELLLAGDDLGPSGNDALGVDEDPVGSELLATIVFEASRGPILLGSDPGELHQNVAERLGQAGAEPLFTEDSEVGALEVDVLGELAN